MKLRRFLSLPLLGAALSLSLWANDARADYVVWEDAKSGFTISYPDTWKIVSNQKTDDVLTIMPPSGRANVQCRMRTREDGRFKTYPSGFDPAIQKIAYGADFWQAYLGEYTNATIYQTHDGAGLGRGYAGLAEAGYWSEIPGPFMPRKAIMFASLYNGTAYILECSSHADAYGDWRADFLSIAKSVDFKKSRDELLNGHYHNFMRDKRFLFPWPDSPESSLR